MTLSITLQGTNGRVWDLRRGIGASGAVTGKAAFKLSDDGIAGLGTPLFLPQTSDSSAADGQTLEDFKVGPRAVLLPGRFRTADMAMHREFWQSLSPYGFLGVYSKLRVTDDTTGVWRELSIRFEDDGGIKLTRDPEKMLHQVWPLSFIADNPWWQGEEVVTSYSLADSAANNFFGDLGGPPFNIAPNFGSSSTFINNPGDVPAWLTYEVEGQATTFYAYLGSSLIYAGITVATGSLLRIVTDPLLQSATLDGVPSTHRLSDFNVVPLPPGGTGLFMSISGSGRARARFFPRYMRGY